MAAVVVLDASVLIGHLDSGDAHHDRARRLLLRLSELQFAASPLTVAEVLVGPARAGLMERAQAALQRLAIATLPLDETGPKRLAELRVRTGLRLPDCCVLLAAEQAAGAVATFDDRLVAAARDLGLQVESA